MIERILWGLLAWVVLCILFWPLTVKIAKRARPRWTPPPKRKKPKDWR